MKRRSKDKGQSSMEHKVFPAFSKVVDEAKGIVEEFFAVFGNIDYGGDIIEPGAFAKTIVERGLNVKVLDHHNLDSISRVIGKPLDIREVGRAELPADIQKRFPDATGGVKATTQYLLDTPEGLGAFKRVAAGAVTERSFGYNVLNSKVEKVKATKGEYGYTLDPDGEEINVRRLKEIRLHEYSLVIFGMNPATATVGVKDADDQEADPEGDKSTNLTELYGRITNAFYQMLGNMEPHLCLREVAIDPGYVVAAHGYQDWADCYLIPFVIDSESIMFAPSTDWVKGKYLFTPIAETEAEAEESDGETYEANETDAAKAGRMISAANAAKLTAAFEQIRSILQAAGVLDPDAEDEDDEEGDGKAVNTETDGAPAGAAPKNVPQAGPGQPPTNREQISRRLAVSLNLVEVENELRRNA